MRHQAATQEQISLSGKSQADAGRLDSVIANGLALLVLLEMEELACRRIQGLIGTVDQRDN